MVADHPAEPESREPDRRSAPPVVRTLPFVLAVLVLAFALRVTTAIRTSVMFEDGPHFLDIARRFAEGDWAGALSHPYHPLYSALTAILDLLIHNREVAALSVSVIGGTAAVFALYSFLRDAFDPRSAIFGAFLLAISPYGVRFTSDIESEGIYLAFFIAAIALLWRGLERGGSSLLFAAGVSAGFAYLARPEGAGVILVGVGLLAVKAYGDGWRVRRLLGAWTALAGGGGIIAAPYLAVLMQQRGGLVLSGKKSVLRTLGLSGESPDSLASAAGNLPWIAIALLALVAIFAISILRRRNSANAIGEIRVKLWLALGASLSIGWPLIWPEGLAEFAEVLISTLRPEVAILVLLGFYVSWASSATSSPREGRSRDAFIATLLVFFGVVLLGLLANYGYLSRRHVLPLVPLLLGYAGLGASWLVDRYASRDTIRPGPGTAPTAWRLPGVALTALACLMFAVSAPKTLRDHREDVLAQRLAAEWLRDQAFEPGPLASSKRRTAYYAERAWLPLREASGLRSFETLTRERVRYIIADDRDPVPQTRGFALRELHRTSAGGRSGIVYELTRSSSYPSRQASAAIGAGPPNHKTH